MRDAYSSALGPPSPAAMLQSLMRAVGCPAPVGSQDRRLLVTIHESGMLRLWDLPTRRWGPLACQCPMHAQPTPFSAWLPPICRPAGSSCSRCSAVGFSGVSQSPASASPCTQQARAYGGSADHAPAGQAGAEAGTPDRCALVCTCGCFIRLMGAQSGCLCLPLLAARLEPKPTCWRLASLLGHCLVTARKPHRALAVRLPCCSRTARRLLLHLSCVL